MAIGAELQKYIDKEIWGSSGTADLADPDSITGLSIEDGYGPEYSSEGGQFPEREGINWIFHIATAMVVEFLTRGLPEWNANIDFVHPAVCIGSDGQLYRTVRSNSGVDPTTDSDLSDWTNASPRGWSALPGLVADGDRVVMRLGSWVGGQGIEPTGAGQYFGAAGSLVAGIADALDIRGPEGQPGGGGERGFQGWTPVPAVVIDGARRLMQIHSYIGGGGDEPAGVGRYLSQNGFTVNPSSAVDIRGERGEKGDKGDRGGVGATYEVAALTADKAIGAAWRDGLSVTATVSGAVEIRVGAIVSDGGGLRVFRGATEVVGEQLFGAGGMQQYVFGDNPSAGEHVYKFQVRNLTTLRKGSSIAIVNPD